MSNRGCVTDVSADQMVERLRQSLDTLLGWAELYAPRMIEERARYDADLDEAEDVLEVAEAWILLNADQWLGMMPKKVP
jgi:hypothetical protein